MNIASFILYTEGKLNLLCIVIIIISGACVSECVHVCYIVRSDMCMLLLTVHVWQWYNMVYVRWQLRTVCNAVCWDQLMLLASYLVHAGMVANRFSEIFYKGNLYAYNAGIYVEPAVVQSFQGFLSVCTLHTQALS